MKEEHTDVCEADPSYAERATQPLHAGIGVCTFDPDFEGQAHQIHDELKSPSQLTGRLVRVNRPTT
jgi:hypothetical protein